jgi:phosphoglycolate phosphatase-like HAD superfamily hydrolase
MIGDSGIDVEAGKNAGCKITVLIESNKRNGVLDVITGLL